MPRCYVVHLSSEAGLDAVRAARAAGVEVHAETCPHYLYLDQAHLEAGDQDFVCAPPLRRLADREALWGAVRDADVEVVATDHCPFTTADRRRGTGGQGWADFTQIPGGLSGVETRLSLVYQGVVVRSAVARAVGGRDRPAPPPVSSDWTAARDRSGRGSTPTSWCSTLLPAAA